MSVHRQRNLAIVVAVLAVVVSVILAFQGAPRTAEATGTRTMSLVEQSHTFATTGGGTTQTALIATLSSTIAVDHELRVWIYQKPVGGAEVEIANGVAWQDASGAGLVRMAIPQTRLVSGATARAEWKTFDAQGTQQSQQSQSITLQ